MPTSRFSKNPFTAGMGGPVQVIDVSDPRHPQRSAQLTLGYIGQPVSLALAGDYAYISGGYGSGLKAIDVSEPARPFQVGTPPRAATLSYMKRRARRLLRRLAEDKPDLYVEAAYHALMEACKGKKELDLAKQWAAVDILFGQSNRYEQRRHGRGAYALKHPRFRIKAREERAPAAWDGRTDLVLKLYAEPNLLKSDG